MAVNCFLPPAYCSLDPDLACPYAPAPLLLQRSGPIRYLLSFRVLFVGCAIALSGCAIGGGRFQGPLRRFEQSLVYQPKSYAESEAAYHQADGNYEDAWFTAADGTRLHGWYLEHPQPRAVVLYCHGNDGNISDLWTLLNDLRWQHGLTLLAFDYRGFGRSEGVPSEAGVFSDARAARAWLAQRTGTAEPDIVLMGRSLGGGISVELASQDGARGLILQSTFTSLPDVAAQQRKWKASRLVPVRWLMVNRMNSLEKIGNYQGPLLQSHGDSDWLIPYQQGEQLFAAAPGPKRFIQIPGGDHNDPQTPEYYQALDEFIAALPPPGATLGARREVRR